jgi:hypothetical protein
MTTILSEHAETTTILSGAVQGTDTSKGYDILLARVRGDWEQSMKTFYDIKKNFPPLLQCIAP